MIDDRNEGRIKIFPLSLTLLKLYIRITVTLRLHNILIDYK